jgi:hypothetical protein
MKRPKYGNKDSKYTRRILWNNGFAAPDLLELASTGEIQFVRPSADGNYEILSQEEAAQMMQQPGQTIEIVSDGRDVQVCHFKWDFCK